MEVVRIILSYVAWFFLGRMVVYVGLWFFLCTAVTTAYLMLCLLF